GRSGDRLARRDLREGERSAARGHEIGGARRAHGPRSGRTVGSRRDRRPRAHRRPPARQPTGAAQADRAAHHSGGLMPATLSAEPKSEPKTLEPAREARRRPRRKAPPRRWVREVQGIAAMTAAVFLLVALTVFDPTVLPGDQSSVVGPVGIWIAWACIRAFGYAAFLV